MSFICLEFFWGLRMACFLVGVESQEVCQDVLLNVLCLSNVQQARGFFSEQAAGTMIGTNTLMYKFETFNLSAVKFQYFWSQC